MRGWCLLALLLAPVVPVAGAAPTAPVPASLDELFSDEGAVDVAVSPSGRYLAGVLRDKEGDVLLLVDVATGQSKTLTRLDRKQVGKRFDAYMTTVYWKTEERLLFRVAVRFAKGVPTRNRPSHELRNLGDRLFAIDRSGDNPVRMLAKNRDAELDWAFDLGEIRSLLVRDPDHILMIVDGEDGRSLFKVNVVKVNTLVQKGKTKRFRGILGRRVDIKKAIVTLADGQSIDVTTGL